MEKFKITKITRYTTDKQGQKLKTKDGRDYTRVNIQTEQYGQKWISGFGSNTNVNWKEGDEVELIIKVNGEYLNFSEPKKIDAVDEKLEQILNKLTTFNLVLQQIKEQVVPHKQGVVKTEVEYPENDLGEPEF